jgi:hypothetical protein
MLGMATRNDLKLWKKETDVPFLDPSLEYIGTSKLRLLTGKTIKALRRPLLVQDQKRNTPLAVIIKYERYIQIQRILLGEE